MTLAYPWLLLLCALPLLPFLRRQTPDTSAAPRLPIGHWLSELPGVQHSNRRPPLWQRILLILAWLCLVLALARPQYVGEASRMPVTGRDLMLIVDISPSMEERDMVVQGRGVTRLQAVKQVLESFIEGRKGDRLGLILFGTQPYVQAPLTLDGQTVRTLLFEAGLGMAGRATAIGDAVGLAVKRLRERPREQRVAILLTDGANTAGEITPHKAADIASAAGVRLYTIGIGAETMVQRGLFGSRRVNPSRDLDETLLTTMAQRTGGRYFRARNMEELQAVYRSIDQLEPMELEGQYYRPVTELYVWPAGAAIALWLLLVAARLRRQRPEGASA
ncbi:vWA domain-containing protein [Marinobacter oulmenensis]|uniref:Ca-activated chloride channel family protein n=1 Tax=Marinobacter oulmenensis TaxID=643747 RepID=A0A840UD12_9GAMM|nr:VWA domain-containing protein [Marinobacter oulmenensis]MBB5321230.1 Ca-activated chloride channel family protein [Marinobacter oulmenensis]